MSNSWLIPFVFQLLAGLFSSLMLWNMGNKKLAGPKWGLVGQSLWFLMIVTSGTWGLLPSNLANAFCHLRNLRKWSRERV